MCTLLVPGSVVGLRGKDLAVLVEEGPVFFRLECFRTAGRPEHPYVQARGGSSYARPDSTLARSFRPPR